MDVQVMSDLLSVPEEDRSRLTDMMVKEKQGPLWATEPEALGLAV